MLDSKTAMSHLGFCAAYRQQQSSFSSEGTARHHFTPVQARDRRKSGRPDMPTVPSPCRSQSAPVTLQVLHHQLSRRGVPISSSPLVASIPLLLSHADYETPQCSVPLRSGLGLSLNHQTHELQKLPKVLLRQNFKIVRRLKNVFFSVSKRSELCQSRVLRWGISAAFLTMNAAPSLFNTSTPPYSRRRSRRAFLRLHL